MPSSLTGGCACRRWSRNCSQQRSCWHPLQRLDGQLGITLSGQLHPQVGIHMKPTLQLLGRQAGRQGGWLSRWSGPGQPPPQPAAAPERPATAPPIPAASPPPVSCLAYITSSGVPQRPLTKTSFPPLVPLGQPSHPVLIGRMPLLSLISWQALAAFQVAGLVRFNWSSGSFWLHIFMGPQEVQPRVLLVIFFAHLLSSRFMPSLPSSAPDSNLCLPSKIVCWPAQAQEGAAWNVAVTTDVQSCGQIVLSCSSCDDQG